MPISFADILAKVGNSYLHIGVIDLGSDLTLNPKLESFWLP